MLQNAKGAAVVLVHGLWMGPWALAALERRLVRSGYRCHRFGYPSTARPLAENVAALAQRVAALEEPVVHFVAHSLGGVVVLRYLQRHPEAPPGRVVLLGSPLRGSGVARRVAGWRWLRWSMGAATSALTEGAGRLPPGREVMMIAGRAALGMGVVLPGLGSPSDGMVAVEETRLPGLAAHQVVAATHTGLLFSREVARAAARFLGGADDMTMKDMKVKTSGA